jgi:Papain family cysteine protease
MTEIGPHLLGRIPSPPDARDYRLKDFLHAAVSDAQLRDEAVAELHKTTVGYINKHWTIPPAGTHWANAEALLAQIGGIAPPPAPAGAVSWTNAEADLDQGNYGTCVGNGWAQWGNTLPVDDRFDETAARAIYYEATIIDGQPDNPDAPGGGQQGSTVRSGAKAMQNRGRLASYAFAATIDEAVAWVLANGPVVMGTDWLDGMFSPDAQGFVTPTGVVAGGHCYVLLGYDPATQVLEYLNSWGASWAKGGHFFMRKTDAETLFASGGEACAAAELA